MAGFSLSGNAFMAKTKKQQALMVTRASDFVRDKTKQVLTELVLNTPQWSGDLASSWKITHASYGFATGERAAYGPLKEIPHNTIESLAKWKGDTQALEYALADNVEALRTVKYNSRITYVNSSPTAGMIYSGMIQEEKLRPGNYIPGDILAVAHTKNKFSFLK